MVLPRKLAFSDRWVYKLVQEVGLSCDGEPILFPDNTTPIKFLVEFNQDEFTRVLSALMTGADLSYPDTAHDVVWLLLRQVECPVSLCDELIECLQPLFDALETQITNVTNIVQEILDINEENGTNPPQPVIEPVASGRCGGAAYVVDFMNYQNELAYLASEESVGDNILEFIPIIIELIPYVGQLPLDELYELANGYFANQYLDYQADFIVLRDDLIGSLACFIEANDDTFTYQVWGDWLEFVAVEFAGNRAGDLYGRYSPLRQTLANQIAGFFNQNQTLQAYFDTIATEFYAGTQDPIVCPVYVCPVECMFEVLANLDPTVTPQDSGIAVVSGSTYTIDASGMWNGGSGEWSAEGDPGTFDPSSVLPSARLYSILVKVGSGGTWYGGDEVFNYVAPASGTLYFAMNDVPGDYGDNSGQLCVNVELVP